MPRPCLRRKEETISPENQIKRFQPVHKIGWSPNRLKQSEGVICQSLSLTLKIAMQAIPIVMRQTNLLNQHKTRAVQPDNRELRLPIWSRRNLAHVLGHKNPIKRSVTFITIHAEHLPRHQHKDQKLPHRAVVQTRPQHRPLRPITRPDGEFRSAVESLSQYRNGEVVEGGGQWPSDY